MNVHAVIMRFSGSSFLSFLLFLGYAAGQKCGRAKGSSRLTGKIVGGYDVGFYKYPWFASLQLDGEAWCGGTLIGSNAVVTAAHCYKEYLQQKGVVLEKVFTVKLGVYKNCIKEKTQRVYKVKKVYVHEEYLKKQPYYDVAVLILDGDSTSYEPACLPPTALSDDSRGREGTIIGLGTIKYGSDKYPCQLHEGRVLIYPDNTCRSMIRNATKDKEDYPMTSAFCAGYMEGQIDACQGDSGGPLLIMNQNSRYVLLGLTSFGYDCAKKNLPGIYTDVSKYLAWVRSKSGVTSELAQAAPETGLNVQQAVGVPQGIVPVTEPATILPAEIVTQAVEPLTVQPAEVVGLAQGVEPATVPPAEVVSVEPTTVPPAEVVPVTIRPADGVTPVTVKVVTVLSNKPVFNISDWVSSDSARPPMVYPEGSDAIRQILMAWPPRRIIIEFKKRKKQAHRRKLSHRPHRRRLDKQPKSGRHHSLRSKNVTNSHNSQQSN